MIQEFLGMDLHTFIVLFIYAQIGVAIMLLGHSLTRDPSSPATPQRFSISFLLHDNWKRIVMNELLIFVTLRFFHDITGRDISQFAGLCVGLGYDCLAMLLKSKLNFLQVNRQP